MQIYCEQCGERLRSQNLRFCEQCGAPVNSADSASDVDHIPAAPARETPVDESLADRPATDEVAPLRVGLPRHDDTGDDYSDAMVTLGVDESPSVAGGEPATAVPDHRRRPWTLLAAGAAVLIMAGGAVFALTRDPSGEQVVAPAPAEGSATPVGPSPSPTAASTSIRLAQRVRLGGTGLQARPGVMALHGSRLVVTHPYDNDLTVLDVSTGLTKDTVSTAKGTSALAVGPDPDIIYATNYRSGTVNAFDLSEGRRIGRATVGSKPTWVALTPDASSLYVMNSGSGSLSVLDIRTFQQTAKIALGGYGFTVAFAPQQGSAFVPLATNDRLARIDMTGPELAATTVVGDVPTDATVTDDDVLVTVLKGKDVIRVNTGSGLVDERIRVGKNASRIVASPDGKQAAILRTRANQVVLLDTVSSKVLGRVSVPSPLDAVYTPDGQSVIVTGKDKQGTVFLISTAERAVTDTVRIGGSVTDVAVNAEGTSAFVLDNTRNLIAQIAVDN